MRFFCIACDDDSDDDDDDDSDDDSDDGDDYSDDGDGDNHDNDGSDSDNDSDDDDDDDDKYTCAPSTTVSRSTCSDLNAASISYPSFFFFFCPSELFVPMSPLLLLLLLV